MNDTSPHDSVPVPIEPVGPLAFAGGRTGPLRSDFALIANTLTLTNWRLLSALRRAAPRVRFVRPGELDGIERPAGALARLDVRRDVDGLEAGFEALLRFERMVPVLNSASALIACHDKLVTAELLARAGLPHPRTTLLRERTDRARGLRPPLVVKPRFGAWGRHVVVCKDAVELARHLGGFSDAAWFRRNGAIAQELIPPAGTDLRLIVAAGEVVGAVERVAARGEWRTNVSLGAERRPTTPPPDAQALAIAAAAAADADLVGVDLLPTPGGGYVVLELNGAADFCDTYSLDDQDVFDRAARRLLEPADPLAAPVDAAVAAV
jgi:RimK family alpha-L-glutamate ligase